jgi:uncharacterized delta-60 repeat protein
MDTKNFSASFKTISIIACVIFNSLCASSLTAAPVYVDATFGPSGNGQVIATFGARAEANAIALQSDGSIVVGGKATINDTDQFIVARYTSTGDLDTSFGPTGIVTTAIGTGALIKALKIQPSDNKIVAAGAAMVNGTSQPTLVRYNTDGSLDTTFGSTGIVETPVGSGASFYALALQSDGKIVAAGATVSDGMPQFLLVRYNSDGTADTTFGANGIVITSIQTLAVTRALVIQTDGKIVAAGFSSDSITGIVSFAVARYASDGTLDPAFGSNGIVITSIDVDSEAHAAVFNSLDGSITLGGSSSPGVSRVIALARYTSSGNLDTTFGNSGITTTAIGLDALANALALQPDGNIVAAGFAADNVSQQVALARYGSTGALDTAFGSNGVITSAIGVGSEARSIALQPDGKIVIGGVSDNSLLLARYLKDSNPFVAINSVVNGSTITTNTVSLSGTSSESDASVGITLDGTTIASAITDTEGAWDAGTSSIITNGSHTLIATLSSNGIAIASTTVNFTVAAPDTIAITSPANGSVVSSAAPPIQGVSSQANATVQVSVDGTLAATVTTDAFGNWSTTSPTLVSGAHTVTADLIVGSTTVASSTNSFTVSLAPSITITTPAYGSTITSSTTPITGTSTLAGATVNVFGDGVFLGFTTTDAQGNWTAGSSPTLANGAHVIVAQLVYPPGTIAAIAASNFTVSV